MTTQLYFWCAILGILGISLQVLIKISSLQKQARTANTSITARDYFKNDWTTICINIIPLAVALIAIDELTSSVPKVVPYLKWSFFFIGYTGSSILNALLSKTQRIVDNVVDVKTNIADNKTT